MIRKVITDMNRFSIIFLLIILFSIAIAIAFFIYDARCQEKCHNSVVKADRLATVGNFRGALKTLDDTDACCNCSHFTEGDEPPEYATARIYLKKYRSQASEEELVEFMKNVHGPILTELMSNRDNQ